MFTDSHGREVAPVSDCKNTSVLHTHSQKQLFSAHASVEGSVDDCFPNSWGWQRETHLKSLYLQVNNTRESRLEVWFLEICQHITISPAALKNHKTHSTPRAN